MEERRFRFKGRHLRCEGHWFRHWGAILIDIDKGRWASGGAVLVDGGAILGVRGANFDLRGADLDLRGAILGVRGTDLDRGWNFNR